MNQNLRIYIYIYGFKLHGLLITSPFAPCKMGSGSVSMFLLEVAAVLFFLGFTDAQSLKLGFYKKTCPMAEDIVGKVVGDAIRKAPTLAAPLLRMHFHDCFVRGCDGSVLLNSTKNNQTEKSAFPNLSLRGFQIIDNAKEAIEEACPGIVSCADILALVARDAIYMLKGPFWEVPTGRRDGKVSILQEALTDLPNPFANITQLKTFFSNVGLNTKDLVVLSGGHTIGTSHCLPFTNRLYNFTGKGDTDPSLDPNYIPHLKRKCKPGDSTTLVEMDPGSFKTFDTEYYTLVSKRRGLFQSDAALLNDKDARTILTKLQSSKSSFFKAFAKSMVKMGKIAVLTGSQGEIRKHCAVVNS